MVRYLSVFLISILFFLMFLPRYESRLDSLNSDIENTRSSFTNGDLDSRGVLSNIRTEVFIINKAIDEQRSRVKQTLGSDALDEFVRLYKRKYEAEEIDAFLAQLDQKVDKLKERSFSLKDMSTAVKGQNTIGDLGNINSDLENLGSDLSETIASVKLNQQRFLKDSNLKKTYEDEFDLRVRSLDIINGLVLMLQSYLADIFVEGQVIIDGEIYEYSGEEIKKFFDKGAEKIEKSIGGHGGGGVGSVSLEMNCRHPGLGCYASYMYVADGDVMRYVVIKANFEPSPDRNPIPPNSF